MTKNLAQMVMIINQSGKFWGKKRLRKNKNLSRGKEIYVIS